MFRFSPLCSQLLVSMLQCCRFLACARATVELYCKAEVILRCGRVAPKANVLQHSANTHKGRNLSFLGKRDPYKTVHTLWYISVSWKDKAEARGLSTHWRAGLGSLRVLRMGQLERNHLRARSPAEFSLLSNLDAASWESPEQAQRTMGTGGVWRRVWGAVCGNQLGSSGLSAEVLRALCAEERRCSW